MVQFQDRSLDAEDRQVTVQMDVELVSDRQVPVEVLESELDQLVVALGMDHLVLG